MKKLSYLIVLALILGLVLTGCTLLSNVGQTPASPQSSEKGVFDDGSTISVYSDTSVLITKVYNKAGGGSVEVPTSQNAVRAWEPAPYSSNYPEEPPEATGSTWDDGAYWFEDSGSSADWIWETHLANDPAVVYASTDDLYDADAAINGRVVLFETTFDIPGNPSSAMLHIAADNGYEAWVNSGTHYLSSSVSGTGWESSNLHEADLQSQDWKHYETFTIAGSELVTGPNTLYVLAGNEYFAPDDVGYPNTPTPATQYNPGAVIFQLDVDYEVAIEEAPEIAIEKSGPVSAHVGDIITYTYTVTTGTGDVPLSAVTVSDDLAGDAAYVSGDDNTNDLLDLLETWIFTADYEVPEGLDPVENTATASGISPAGIKVDAEDDWSVDILNPEILVEKSADTEAAAPGETVTYNYTVNNTGDCILYDVSLDDDVAGTITLTGLTDEDLDGEFDDLAVDGSATGTADYEVTFGDPEWLINIATAEGTDELELTVYGEDSCTIHTMGARTIGYWKTHPEEWCWSNFPPEGSIFGDKIQAELLAYFPGLGAEVDGVNPLEMLRAQLIAAELNVACFDDAFDYSRYEAANIDDVIDDAEAFLEGLPEDLNAFWSNLSKQQQNNVKEIANPLKDTLEEFNAMGDEIFE